MYCTVCSFDQIGKLPKKNNNFWIAETKEQEYQKEGFSFFVSIATTTIIIIIIISLTPIPQRPKHTHFHDWPLYYRFPPFPHSIPHPNSRPSCPAVPTLNPYILQSNLHHQPTHQPTTTTTPTSSHLALPLSPFSGFSPANLQKTEHGAWGGD